MFFPCLPNLAYLESTCISLCSKFHKSLQTCWLCQNLFAIGKRKLSRVAWGWARWALVIWRWCRRCTEMFLATPFCLHQFKAVWPTGTVLAAKDHTMSLLFLVYTYCAHSFVPQKRKIIEGHATVYNLRLKRFLLEKSAAAQWCNVLRRGRSTRIHIHSLWLLLGFHQLHVLCSDSSWDAFD